MRCMKVDYGYPESIGKIVNELENQLITLYAKVGKKIQERNKQKEEQEVPLNENRSKSKLLIISNNINKFVLIFEHLLTRLQSY